MSSVSSGTSRSCSSRVYLAWWTFWLAVFRACCCCCSKSFKDWIDKKQRSLDRITSAEDTDLERGRGKRASSQHLLPKSSSNSRLPQDIDNEVVPHQPKEPVSSVVQCNPQRHDATVLRDGDDFQTHTVNEWNEQKDNRWKHKKDPSNSVTQSNVKPPPSDNGGHVWPPREIAVVSDNQTVHQKPPPRDNGGHDDHQLPPVEIAVDTCYKTVQTTKPNPEDALEIDEYQWKYIEKFHKAELNVFCGKTAMYTYSRISLPYKLIIKSLHGDPVDAVSDKIACLVQKVDSYVDHKTFYLSGDTKIVWNIIKGIAMDDKKCMCYFTTTGTVTTYHLVGPKTLLPDAKKQIISSVKPVLKTDLLCIGFDISRGDLCHQKVAAVVNPANANLKHGSGAARAIADAAGRAFVTECNELIRQRGPLKVTEAVHTSAGKMESPIQFIIHVVGPKEKQYGGKEDELFNVMVKTFSNCLTYANDILNVDSLAVPAISSGKFGVPKSVVAKAAYQAMLLLDRDFQSGTKLQHLAVVRFVNIDEESTKAFHSAFQRIPSSNQPAESVSNSGIPSGDCSSIPQPKPDSKPYSQPVIGKSGDVADDCVICMGPMVQPKQLSCGHKFCQDCIDESFATCQPKCPCCGQLFGVMKGTQPPGTMSVMVVDNYPLPSYEAYSTIRIDYNFPHGTQNDSHPNPGQPYSGTHRTAYLPNNEEGREICELLQKAFDAKLIFTVGRSITTGKEGQVIWNDIHHKTKKDGPFGYPDPGYFSRVRSELAAKGIGIKQSDISSSVVTAAPPKDDNKSDASVSDDVKVSYKSPKPDEAAVAPAVPSVVGSKRQRKLVVSSSAANDSGPSSLQYTRPEPTQPASGPPSLPCSLSIPSPAPAEHEDQFSTPHGIDVVVTRGDLLNEKTDAIVNPCNIYLSHYGGAAKAIADAAGKALVEECQRYISERGNMGITDVVATTAGNMHPPIRYVLHAAGPPAADYPDPNVLRQTVLETFYKCLDTANSLNISSISIPAISSGIYGVPKPMVADAAYKALMQFDSKFLLGQPPQLTKVRFVNLDVETTDVFVETFKKRRSGSGDISPAILLEVDLSPKTPNGVSRLDSDRQVAKPVHPDHASDAIRGDTVRVDTRTGDEKVADGDGKLKSSIPVATPAATSRAKVEDCVICMCPMSNPKKLPCGHEFCTDCINESFAKCQPKCPSCGRLFGIMKGNQPPGTMLVRTVAGSLAGYEAFGTILIEYDIPSGIQNDTHPNPGQAYCGTSRSGYLPDCPEGRDVCELLRQAFDAKLIFTVGRSITTGAENCVIWNDIHHKTSPHGQFGYPDPTYLSRIKDELAAKGIGVPALP